MSTIEGRCRTNWDDDKNLAWPELFAALPRPGDWIETADLKHRREVCRVTFIFLPPGPGQCGEATPGIEVHLKGPGGK